MKRNLVIEENDARNLYKTASLEFKETLETSFGKGFFSTKIIDRIKTYEDACKELNMVPISDSGLTIDEIAYIKLKTIIKALNEGWIPDWSNSSEYKYYPYFNMNDKSSGFGFSGSSYDYGISDSYVSSRLCFKSEELVTYGVTQFIELYEDFLK